MNDTYSEYFGGEDQVLDFYQKLRRKIDEQLLKRKESTSNIDKASSILVDALIWLPDLFHLGVKLLFDGQVPARNKGALVAALAYVISPIDLIPDAIPIAGWIDDLVVMAMGLNSFIDTKDQEINSAVSRHWAGKEEALGMIKHILDVADEAATFLPKRLMNIIKGMFPKSGGIR